MKHVIRVASIHFLPPSPARAMHPSGITSHISSFIAAIGLTFFAHGRSRRAPCVPVAFSSTRPEHWRSSGRNWNVFVLASLWQNFCTFIRVFFPLIYFYFLSLSFCWFVSLAKAGHPSHTRLNIKNFVGISRTSFNLGVCCAAGELILPSLPRFPL